MVIWPAAGVIVTLESGSQGLVLEGAAAVGHAEELIVGTERCQASAAFRDGAGGGRDGDRAGCRGDRDVGIRR